MQAPVERLEAREGVRLRLDQVDVPVNL